MRVGRFHFLSVIAEAHVVNMVVFFYCTAKIHGRKQSEHVSLQQGNEQFQEVHKDGESYRNRTNCHAFENKDQGE